MKQLASLAEIAACEAGDQITVTALLTDIKQQQTSTNSDYIRLYLRDDVSNVSVPLWNDTLESIKDVYKIDTVYTFTAVVQLYLGKGTIKRIMSAIEVTDSGVLRRYKQHMFKHATDSCVQMVLSTVQRLQPTVYGPYLAEVYGKGNSDDERFIRIQKAFASINHHDNYPGGLINHVGGMLRIADDIRNNYLAGRCESIWNVDWDYVAAAILLHDIGKLATYTNVSEYTVRFKDDCTLDHNQIGVGILYVIESHISDEQLMPYEVFQRLAYSIANHDKQEMLYEHKHVEDKILSYIDGLDATLAVACKLNLGESI